MALVAEDMSYVGGAACTPDKPCIGRDAMRRIVQGYIAGHDTASIVGLPEVSGTTVKAHLESGNPDRRAIGVERTLSDVTVDVRNGLLTSWASINAAADPQTATWQAVQRQQPVQAVAAADGEENPTSR